MHHGLVDNPQPAPGRGRFTAAAAGAAAVVALASNRHIARSLGVSLKTVQNHVSHILDKLQAADRTQAALRARGLSPPPH